MSLIFQGMSDSIAAVSAAHPEFRRYEAMRAIRVCIYLLNSFLMEQQISNNAGKPIDYAGQVGAGDNACSYAGMLAEVAQPARPGLEKRNFRNVSLADLRFFALRLINEIYYRQ